MKLIIALTVAAALTLCAADNQLTSEEKSGGWKLLFDGKTMNGWTDSTGKPMTRDAWSIEDGCLKPAAKPTLTEDLFSKDKYTNFELEFDWKISHAGNSGVKYRIQDHIYIGGQRARGKKFELIVDDFSKNRLKERPTRGQDYVVGFEYQVIDNSANPDALSAQTHAAAALYDIQAPTHDVTKPVGEWNHSKLVVNGEHVEHWLNGEKVVDASIAPDVVRAAQLRRWGQTPAVLNALSNQPRKSCPISLQNHDAEAWFKNIKIKKL
ncbi:MAG TPA: DUF1080 domain-containing protein [Bryobacteraceae bacterium]|jgi:hypothetical protein